MKPISLILLIVLISACSGMSNEEQALATEHTSLSTQVANSYQTATAETDRMLVTLEHAQTEVRRVRNQGTALASTLVAEGLNPDALAAVNPAAVPDTASTPAPNNNTPADAAIPLATEAADLEPSPTAVLVTPFTLTPEGNGPPRLSNIVLAEAVGADDCATNTASQFSSTSEQIYVVAVADNIQPGTTITSRWQQEGVEQTAFDFTPDFAIEEACIWFYIDQTDVAFTSGNWSVTLEINGQSVGAPIPFTITG